MSIEDHLLDLVKGAKAMTESVAQTVEKVVEEIRKDKPVAKVFAAGTRVKNKRYDKRSVTGRVSGRKSPYDENLVEVEWDDGYVTGEQPEDLEEVETPVAAEEVKVNKGSVYTVKDYTGPLFRYREKIYRKETPSIPAKVCGVMGSEWVAGVWAVAILDNERFLFLEDTEVVAVV